MRTKLIGQDIALKLRISEKSNFSIIVSSAVTNKTATKTVSSAFLLLVTLNNTAIYLTETCRLLFITMTVLWFATDPLET